jgi:quinol monooxygenase YgiN
MLLVVSALSIDPARREDILLAVRELTVNTREEAGCVGFRLLQDPDNPNDLVFLETWQSRDALDSHLSTAPVARFRERLAGAITARDTKLHEIERSMPL